MNLYVGMRFKPLSEPDSYGECLSLSENRFTYRWFSATGEPEDYFSEIPIRNALNNFEYYGWVVLSGLEKELI